MQVRDNATMHQEVSSMSTNEGARREHKRKEAI